MLRVLVAEDEPKMAALIRRALEAEDIACALERTGEGALAAAAADSFDVLVLDVMLPGIDGFEVCRRLREAQIWTPALLLTARSGVDDRVRGLDSGADDYLTKPFAFAELLARLRALTRRHAAQATLLVVGGLKLDPVGRRVWRGATAVELSPREFDLLELFMRHPGQVLSRTQVLDQVWDYDYASRSNVVDVYVRYLREKVDLPFGTRSLRTVRGAGYRLDP